MAEFSIRDRCKINTNIDADTFVGIQCEDNSFSVHFPLGFHLPENDKELRKDILLLMSTIASTTGRRDSEISDNSLEYDCDSFPFQAYLNIIYDFYARGYYKENEVQYHISKKGKIDWNRTIKTQRPYVQDTDVFYLDFITKKNTVNENELITLIHEYCVYDAFARIGWLFTAFMPKEPRIKFNKKMFRSVVKEKLLHTYNDKNKILLRSMMAIIEYRGDKNATRDYKYGTYRFEYVWENLIDRVFGIKGKEKYYPKTTWNIDGIEFDAVENIDNSSLRPDSIMVYGGDIYVLDAKYYKYGQYRNPAFLPKSTDINKQITYGEYIAEQEKFKKMHGDKYKVYNAFLMPFDSAKSGSLGYAQRIGVASGNWKKNDKSYERVQGILLDVKHMMKIGVRADMDEISKLADMISQYL